MEVGKLPDTFILGKPIFRVQKMLVSHKHHRPGMDPALAAVELALKKGDLVTVTEDDGGTVFVVAFM